MKKAEKSKLIIALVVGSCACTSLWAAESTSTTPAPVAAPEDQHPDKLFEAYPRDKSSGGLNDAFGAFVEGHLNAKSRLREKNLIYATWFLGGRQNVAVQNVLEEDGRFNHWRSVWSWAEYGGGSPQHVDATKMKLIQQALKEVPTSDPHPPLSKLLIFSFQHDGKWLTRTFDKDKLPAPISDIFKLLDRSTDASI